MRVLLIYFPIQSNGLSIEFWKENNSRDIWISYDEQSGKHRTVTSVSYTCCAPRYAVQARTVLLGIVQLTSWDCVLFSWSGELDWAGHWATARIVMKKILRWLWKAVTRVANSQLRPTCESIATIYSYSSWCYIGRSEHWFDTTVVKRIRRYLFQIRCSFIRWREKCKMVPQKITFWRRNCMKIYAFNAPNRIWGPPESQKFSNWEGDTPLPLDPSPRTAITDWTLQPPHSKIASYATANQR